MSPMPRVFLLISLSVFLLQLHPIKAQDPCKVILDKKTEKVYQDGIGLFKKGSYSLAGVAMKNVLKDEPDCIDAMYVLGLINFKKSESNFNEAEKQFRRVVELCPGYDVYANYYLAEIYFGKDSFELAVPQLNAFLKDVDKIKKDEDYNRATELLRYAKFYTELTKNPVPFLPKVVEGISTTENEYLPILSPDNQMAFLPGRSISRPTGTVLCRLQR